MDIKNDVRISVIVPSYNEEKMIGRCLRAIRAQKFRDYELIVVDGHSTDNTVKIAKKYADRVVFDEGRGAGAARNLAARSAKAKILAFTDADTIVCGNWLATIDMDFGHDENLVGLGGLYFFIDGGKLNALLVKLGFGIGTLVGKIPPFAGNNCAYSKAAFLKAGGYREDVCMLDDLELAMRMKKLFGNLKFDKALCVNTSMRRIRQKGCLTAGVQFILAYLALLFGVNLKIGKNYLREIKR